MHYFSDSEEVWNADGTTTNDKQSRKEVHQKGLWHRVVHVWLVNPRGELLVQRVHFSLFSQHQHHTHTHTTQLYTNTQLSLTHELLFCNEQ